MTRTARIAAYRQRLTERLARVDEDVAYRFARAQAQVGLAIDEGEDDLRHGRVRNYDDVRRELGFTRIQPDMRAAADAELGARVGHGPGRRA